MSSAGEDLQWAVQAAEIIASAWLAPCSKNARMSLERKALVVDDDAGVRTMIKRILSLNNFEVDTANDGAEALDKIVHNDYGVIVLDLMMPRLDGRGVVDFLAAEMPETLSRVIAVTAFGRNALQRVCPPVGRFLEKPFDIQHLVNEATECYWFSGGGVA